MRLGSRWLKGLTVVSVLAGISLLAYSFWLIQDDSHSGVEATAEPAPSLPSEPNKGIGPKPIPGIKPTASGHHELSESTRQTLRQVSEVYREQMKYPEFSQPIDAEELDSKYSPDVTVAADLPARLDDPDSPTLSLLPNQFRYFYGDSMLVSAEIQGLSETAGSAISARLLRDQEVVALATVIADEERPHAWLLDFSTLQLDGVEWMESLQIQANFEFEGQQHLRSVSLEYFNTIARLEQVAPARVQSEYLEIPVFVSTLKPGFHRIRANLYDAESGEPLIHLRAEAELTNTQGELVLKAHIAALKAAGSEGPYRLRDMQLVRMPSSPEFITEYGRIDRREVTIDGFGFDEYEDRPYINEKSRRIAGELQRLGS